MNKSKVMIFGGTAAAIAASFFLVAQGATAVTPSCAGAVSGNQVTWTATSSGGNAPYAFLWSGDSKVAGSSSTSIVATYPVNGTFTAVIQATDASSTVGTGACSATVTSNSTATSTPGVPHAMKASLTINPNGQFEGRGMIVTSVASGSFQAKVWGITFTVNGSLKVEPKPNTTSTAALAQIKVGDEVSVTGKIDPANSLVVNGKVIRDFTVQAAIQAAIQKIHTEENDNRSKNAKHGNGKQGK